MQGITLNTDYKPVCVDTNRKGFPSFEWNQWIYKFDHTLVSVVCHKQCGEIITYGNNENPFEILITNSKTLPECDCLGYLSENMVNGVLHNIEKFVKENKKIEEMEDLLKGVSE